MDEYFIEVDEETFYSWQTGYKNELTRSIYTVVEPLQIHYADLSLGSTRDESVVGVVTTNYHTGVRDKYWISKEIYKK